MIDSDLFIPAFGSKYADLAEVLDTVKPTLAKHGFAVTQFPAYAPNEGVVVVETVLLHRSGEYIAGAVGVPLGGKKDAQAVGSAITYARRYSLAAVLGISQDDDDGNNADPELLLPGSVFRHVHVLVLSS